MHVASVATTEPEQIISDDRSQRGSPDNKRIDIHDPYEVRHWSKSLRVTAEQLKEAVARVGTSPQKCASHRASSISGKGPALMILGPDRDGSSAQEQIRRIRFALSANAAQGGSSGGTLKPADEL
jgi:hypothetical protein